MADTDQFVRQTVDRKDVQVTGLVLNGRGLERAVECGLKHVSLSASASNSHSLKNVRKSSAEAVEIVSQLIKQAEHDGITVRAGVQCVFGCVYEGAVSPDRVIKILQTMHSAGANEFNLADTTGMAQPYQVRDLITKIKALLPDVVLSLHLHDTRGLGLVNMFAGYEAGVRIFDTSVGGLGGCPFVKGASGNVATEDAVHMFEAMGVSTGIDIVKCCEVVTQYEQLLGRSLPGRMKRVLAGSAAC